MALNQNQRLLICVNLVNITSMCAYDALIAAFFYSNMFDVLTYKLDRLTDEDLKGKLRKSLEHCVTQINTGIPVRVGGGGLGSGEIGDRQRETLLNDQIKLMEF